MAKLSSSDLLYSFRFRIIILLTIVGLLAGGTFWCFFNNQVVFSTILLILTVIAVYQLFHIINKTNHDLTQFLSGILYNDFESSYRQRLHQDDSQQMYKMFNIMAAKRISTSIPTSDYCTGGYRRDLL